MLKKKTVFHTVKFQREFYDKLGKEKGKDKGLFSCGYEERYNPKLIIQSKQAYNVFKNLFSNLLKEGNNGIVLDLCTGSGIHLPILSQHAKTVFGADISMALLERAQEITEELELHNTILFQTQAESLPLKDDVCDAVVMIDAIHHVENQLLVMEELRRVVKDDALFLLIEPNVSNPLVFIAHLVPKEERGALRLNTAKGLKRLLDSYLDEVSVTPFNYVASMKTNFIERTIFQVIRWLCGSVFFFWPIRFLIRGYFRKSKIQVI